MGQKKWRDGAKLRTNWNKWLAGRGDQGETIRICALKRPAPPERELLQPANKLVFPATSFFSGGISSSTRGLQPGLAQGQVRACLVSRGELVQRDPLTGRAALEGNALRATSKPAAPCGSTWPATEHTTSGAHPRPGRSRESAGATLPGIRGLPRAERSSGLLARRAGRPRSLRVRLLIHRFSCQRAVPHAEVAWRRRLGMVGGGRGGSQERMRQKFHVTARDTCDHLSKSSEWALLQSPDSG